MRLHHLLYDPFQSLLLSTQTDQFDVKFCDALLNWGRHLILSPATPYPLQFICVSTPHRHEGARLLHLTAHVLDEKCLFHLTLANRVHASHYLQLQLPLLLQEVVQLLLQLHRASLILYTLLFQLLLLLSGKGESRLRLLAPHHDNTAACLHPVEVIHQRRHRRLHRIKSQVKMRSPTSCPCLFDVFPCFLLLRLVCLCLPSGEKAPFQSQTPLLP
ncbi:hypothetical protein TRSC58_03278 [Trypanosoma rangeli SC58]|uniref:Uncharacterized protein n=1 Tax=Trypanosoma rangeli SC58 TaxID=429131 RepID=A0A061J275_TRYRA|nr:hypothetical protein TRSC58_03278 [Trypanosoma rangeli SC58]